MFRYFFSFFSHSVCALQFYHFSSVACLLDDVYVHAFNIIWYAIWFSSIDSQSVSNALLPLQCFHLLEPAIILFQNEIKFSKSNVLHFSKYKTDFTNTIDWSTIVIILKYSLCWFEICLLRNFELLFYFGENGTLYFDSSNDISHT